jgi:hypothetical protein
MRLILSVFILILSIDSINAQVYPKDYFQYPMDTPTFMSAPFGSLRENHFHSGMDIRTGEKIGLPIYAVADGYVSRIKYASTAYGKAIYINHPNGYTSVYAHLQHAHADIAEYIRHYQYEKETFEFDHFPTNDKLPVKKGDIIGWSGNSGTSTGPHLHFEIRNSKSEAVINPQHFGIFGVDLLPPIIKHLSIYSLEHNRPILTHDVVLSNQKLINTDSGFVLKDTIQIGSRNIGFAIDAIDYLLDTKKEYSLYGIDLSIDNKKYFTFRLDMFRFDDTRCINTHLDFQRYKIEDKRIQKLFLDDGNQIRNYPYMRNKGKVQLLDTLVHIAKITAIDFMNKSYVLYVNFKHTGLRISAPKSPANRVATCYPKVNNSYTTSDLQLQIPQGALYDTMDLIMFTQAPTEYMQSKLYKLSDNIIPLHRNIKIAIKTFSDKQQDKMILCTLDKGLGIRSIGGEYANGWVTTHTNSFGDFFIGIDTIAPKIIFMNVQNDILSDTVSMKFAISDDLSGIASYKGYINNKWEVFEYDAKNNLLEYYFDINSPSGKLDVEIVVIDKKKNSTTFKKSIIRQ